MINHGSATLHRADDDGESAVLAAERVVWQLLHVFFVSQGRVVGSIAQDLAYWLFTNASLLCGGFTADDVLRQVTSGNGPHRLHHRRPCFYMTVVQDACCMMSAPATVYIHAYTCLPSPQAAAATIPEDAPTYWQAVQRCVALGWLVPAADLLGLHTAWQRVQLGSAADDVSLAGQLQVLEAVLILLRRMPALAAPGRAGPGMRRMAAAAGEDAAADFVQKRCDAGKCADWAGMCVLAALVVGSRELF